MPLYSLPGISFYRASLNLPQRQSIRKRRKVFDRSTRSTSGAGDVSRRGGQSTKCNFSYFRGIAMAAWVNHRTHELSSSEHLDNNNNNNNVIEQYKMLTKCWQLPHLCSPCPAPLCLPVAVAAAAPASASAPAPPPLLGGRKLLWLLAKELMCKNNENASAVVCEAGGKRGGGATSSRQQAIGNLLVGTRTM